MRPPDRPLSRIAARNVASAEAEIIQEKAAGLRGMEEVPRDFRIPREVYIRMGPGTTGRVNSLQQQHEVRLRGLTPRGPVVLPLPHAPPRAGGWGRGGIGVNLSLAGCRSPVYRGCP